jgi:beta-lactamase class A
MLTPKRLLLIALLIFLAGVSGFVVFRPINNQANTETVSPQAPQENVSAEAAPKPTSGVDTVLEAKIHDWAKANPGDYGVMLREVTGDKRTASYQAEKQFISASTYKLFVTYTVLSWVEKGEFGLDKQVVNGKDIPACMDSLLLYSSDECGWPMGNLVGWPRLSIFLNEQGFENTQLNNYDKDGDFIGDKFSTATDEAEIAWRLHNGSLLNKTHSDMILSRLKRQVWRQRIPAGVPEGIVVADKPGWIYDIENDTAIVYGEKSTYVLAIMSKGSNVKNLAALSKVIYEHLNQ